MATKDQSSNLFSRMEWQLVGSTYRAIAGAISTAIEKGEGLPREQAIELLIELRHLYIRRADGCDALAEEKRPGRPRVRRQERTENSKAPPEGWPTNALLTGYVPLKPKKKLGRPIEGGPDYDCAVFQYAESVRDELKQSRRTRPTIKAAIDAINERYAQHHGKRVTSFVAKNFNATKAAYTRGRKLSEEQSEIENNPNALKSI